MELDETISLVPKEKEVFCIRHVNPEKRKMGPPITLKGNEVVLGRHPEAQVVVRSENVSRKHAVLKRTADSWNIQDTKSMNGVWVNTQELQPFVPRELKTGDVFSLGSPEEDGYKYLFFSQSKTSQLSPPCKVLREDSEQARRNKELDDRVQNLQRQLEEKEAAEKRLQDQLQVQERVYQENLELERERILSEKKQLEEQWKQEHEEKLSAEKKKLMESLQNQRAILLAEKERVEKELRQKITQEMEDSLRKEQQRLHKELEQGSLKAQLLEQQLAETCHLQNQSKLEMMSRFGTLMESELNCSICSELFAQAYTLGCSHTFCKHCITMWKKKKNECPICRAKIKSMAHALVLDNFIEQMVENLSPEMKVRRLQILKERGLPSAKLDFQVLKSGGGGVPSATVSTAASSTAASNQIILLPMTTAATTTTTTSTTAAMPNQQTILLRPVNNAALPPELQAALGSLTSSGNTVRVVTVSGQQTLRFITNTSVASGSVRQPTGNAVIRAPAPGQPRMPYIRGGPQSRGGARVRGGVRTRGGARTRGGGAQATSSLLRTNAPRIDVSQTATEVIQGDVLAPVTNVQGNGDIIVVPTDQLESTTASNVEISSLSSTNTNTQDSVHESVSTNNSDETFVPENSPNTQNSVSGTNSTSSNDTSGTDSGNAIVITDSEEDSNSDENSLEESDDSDSYIPRYINGTYYGGYGRCYRCGERGHWANSCSN